MTAAGVAGESVEATTYIVEQAATEGRKEGFSAVDGKFMDWVGSTFGKSVGNVVRDFAAMVRGWPNGLG